MAYLGLSPFPVDSYHQDYMLKIRDSYKPADLAFTSPAVKSHGKSMKARRWTPKPTVITGVKWDPKKMAEMGYDILRGPPCTTTF